MNEKLLFELVEELWASFGYNTPEEHAEVIYKLISKELISEFLRDYKWYLAFEIHYKWIIFTQGCRCKTNPFKFRDWMIKKWEGME